MRVITAYFAICPFCQKGTQVKPAVKLNTPVQCQHCRHGFYVTPTRLRCINFPR